MSFRVSLCRFVLVRVGSCRFVSVCVGLCQFVLDLYPQSPVMDSKLIFINFPGVFVNGNGRYRKICYFHSILLPNK